MRQTFESRIAKLFGMSDEVWARHANPWSAYTRITTLPLITLAVWSRVWLGWWCLAGVALALLWTWFNPRIFAKPRSTDNWASRGVFGERLWLARRTTPVPERHRLMPHILSLGCGFGLAVLIWGLWRLEAWPTVTGNLFVIVGKLWFFDRMVWIYEDMKDENPTYGSWLYDEPKS